jgi:hypothetical protein
VKEKRTLIQMAGQWLIQEGLASKLEEPKTKRRLAKHLTERTLHKAILRACGEPVSITWVTRNRLAIRVAASKGT